MAELPPKDVWFANGNNIGRWRPIIDLIEIHQTREGKAIRLRFDGIEREIELGQAEADHLADLLRARS